MSEISPPATPKKEIIAPRREPFARTSSDDPLRAERDYGEARLWLAARDPRSLFAYWEFRPEEHPDAAGDDGRARFFLRIYREGGEVENGMEIEKWTGSAFFPAQLPDSGYVADLGFFAGGVWCFIARSAIARTPTEIPGAAVSPIFATIPAHLGLGKMRDLAGDSALPGESPASTTARIQSDARHQGDWPSDHGRLLAEALGVTASAPGALSANSLTLTQLIRHKLAATAPAAEPGVMIPAPQIESAPTSPGASWPTSRWSEPRS